MSIAKVKHLTKHSFLLSFRFPKKSRVFQGYQENTCLQKCISMGRWKQREDLLPELRNLKVFHHLHPNQTHSSQE
jgi:hypothetical protein